MSYATGTAQARISSGTASTLHSALGHQQLSGSTPRREAERQEDQEDQRGQGSTGGPQSRG